jgi:hypothetical protein
VPQSEERKIWCKKWRASPVGREATKRYYENYKSSPQYKEITRKQGKRYWEKNKKKCIASTVARCREKRKIAILHYGGNPPRCACCGESRYEFLSLNHIGPRGIGARDRERHSGQAGVIRHIIKTGFPNGYNVLCHNCNMSMGYYGYCPHQKWVPNKCVV